MSRIPPSFTESGPLAVYCPGFHLSHTSYPILESAVRSRICDRFKVIRVVELEPGYFRWLDRIRILVLALSSRAVVPARTGGDVILDPFETHGVFQLALREQSPRRGRMLIDDAAQAGLGPRGRQQPLFHYTESPCQGRAATSWTGSC